MLRKHVSIVVALFTAAGVAVCIPDITLAQDSGTPPPPPTAEQGSSVPPPPSGGNTGGTTMPPPSGGSGEFRPGANDNRFSPPEMLGRPPEGSVNRPSDDAYRQEYQRRYEQEVGRQTEQRTREMQLEDGRRPQRFAPQSGEGAFRPKGQPFMEGGKDNAQGRPFMEDGSSEGRPFSGEGFRGGEAGSEDMDKKMNEREKMMQQEQLQQMKRGMVSGMGQGLTQMKRMMERLSKRGISVPDDARALVNELSSALAKVKAATELTEEVEAAMELLQDKGTDLGDIGQKLGMLEHLSQAGKQVEKEFARMDKEVAKARKAKTARDYPEVIAKIEGDVSALKQRWTSIRSEALSGDTDPEDMREGMEDIFEGVGEVRQSLGLLRQLGSISKMIKSAEKEIAKFEKEIAREKKAGKDTTALASLLSEARAKLAEIKALSGQRGFDPEDLFDLMHDLEKIRNDALSELDKIAGTADRSAQVASIIQSLSWRRLGF